jgi:two-component system, NarL family, response regulator LiaR
MKSPVTKSPEIVFIEDELLLAKAVIAHLKYSGMRHTIQEAHSAQIGWDLIVRHEPLVVILDLCLDAKRGVTSGLDMLQELARANLPLNVIVLTGYNDPEIERLARAYGAFEFLSKPPNIDLLHRAIDEALVEGKKKRSRATTFVGGSSVQ